MMELVYKLIVVLLYVVLFCTVTFVGYGLFHLFLCLVTSIFDIWTGSDAGFEWFMYG